MTDNRLEIKFPLSERYIGALLPLVRSYAEDGRLSAVQAGKYELAAEEFLTSLASDVPGSPVLAKFFERGRHLSMSFSLVSKGLDLSGLNMVNIHSARRSGEIDTETRLLLVSRSVDEFSAALDERGVCSFNCSVEKDYAEQEPLRSPIRAVKPYRVSESADVQRVSLLLAAGLYENMRGKTYCRRPDSFLADQKAGIISMLCLVDANDSPVAVIPWKERKGTVIFEGPFVLCENDRDEAAAAAIEQLVTRFGKEDVVCALTERKDFANQGGYFERVNGVSFRVMGEDDGGTVWAVSEMAPLLKKQYEAMELLRNVLVVKGDIKQERTLLSLSLQADLERASLRPEIIGRDFKEVLAAHVEELKKRKYETIALFLPMRGIEPAIAAGLASEQGFGVWYIIPGVAGGDILVLRYEG